MAVTMTWTEQALVQLDTECERRRLTAKRRTILITEAENIARQLRRTAVERRHVIEAKADLRRDRHLVPEWEDA